jgi:hypothetical protein
LNFPRRNPPFCLAILHFFAGYTVFCQYLFRVESHQEVMAKSGSTLRRPLPPSGIEPHFSHKRSRVKVSVALTFLVLLAVTVSYAAELKPVTLQGWDAYVRTVTSSMDQRANGTHSFLCVDETPDVKKRVLAGEAVVEMHPHDKIRDGLIHHWVGAMFLPGASLDQVTGVLADYDHYKDIYTSMVMKSKCIERNDCIVKVNLLLVGKAAGVVGAVDTDDEVQTVKLDGSRIYSISTSVRSQEISDYGKPNEKLLEQDKGPGYVWRTFGITRLMQRDGGVYYETETVTLSRGIPWAFRWLIEPVTERLPRSIMTQSLNDLRESVNKSAKASSAQNKISK